MKKPLSEEIFYNAWLEEYHGITVGDLLEQEPELCKTSEWYKKYAVTQAQHDEWYEWAITTIAKYYGCSRKKSKRDFSFAYLNLAPSIKEDENKD